ncbi:meiotic recombination protein REC114 [Pundamilia nyererei]|uniref:Meiotic recombination protein REC114 n=1 Tax=Pundamilia nyererei TaxID=303518 RepID=A0A9Y3QY72_9CICH|nr:PREDICTED: meiotic recombination protein REC114 [Pundamilia nyererei]
MISTRIWKLKRYGRFIPGSKETGVTPWKVLEAKDNKPEIVLTIVESGHLLVLQGQESLTKGFNEGHMKYSVEELDISAQM